MSVKPVAQMTVEDVCVWLGLVGLEQHARVFAENRINGTTLPELDKAALKEIGIKNALDQAKIVGAINALKANTAHAAGLNLNTFIA